MTERTNEEILARIAELMPHDLLGFRTNDLVLALPFEHAKPHLAPTANAEQWTPVPRDLESLKARMLEYMPFAWEKANNCRGISAARSLSHYEAWLWLAGIDLGNMMDYEFYGKPQLVRICEHFGWNHAQWDDGVRTNNG
jgi:hypothetical protein